jgi:hypothetical protein
VINSWLKLPIMVIKTPFHGFDLSRIKTLPNHSPIRLGVKTLTETPDNIASYDFKKEIFSIFLIRNCHFSDSIPQFTIMSIEIQAMKKYK